MNVMRGLLKPKVVTRVKMNLTISRGTAGRKRCLPPGRRGRAATSSPTSSSLPCWWLFCTSDITTSARSLLFCLRAGGRGTHGDPKHQTIKSSIITELDESW